MNISQKLKDLGYQKGQYKNLYFDDNNQVAYSDGDVEEVIYNQLKSLPKDTLSRERQLENAIVDWPTKYHFCWERSNLLKPIDFKSDDCVLELGGGTGVLSHYICGKVKRLVSIEGTLSRAKSISARCQYFDNIDIIVANFLQLDLIELFGEHSFDKITLIGVLEYTPKFSSEEQAITKLLSICNRLIKPDGELIVAIENKIGLKYLLGFQEDHNAKAFYGPQSLYKANEATTFTKQELNAKLKAASFKDISYYLPFPDYKLPKVIIKDSEEIYSRQGENLVSALLYDCKSQNYSGKTTIDFHEGRILSNFITEKQLDIVSNSFLLIARNQKTETSSLPLAYYFSTNRQFEFANEIQFTKVNDTIKVIKTWFGNKTNGFPLNLNVDGQVDSEFIYGKNVHQALVNFYILDEKEKYEALFRKWLSFLKTQIHVDELKAFDMMPFNTIITENDVFRFIDIDEWQTDNKMSMSQVVSRYIISNKKHFEWLLSTKKDSAAFFINQVLEHFNLMALSDAESSTLSAINRFLNDKVSRRPYLKKPIVPKQSIFKRAYKKFLPYRVQKFLKK